MREEETLTYRWRLIYDVLKNKYKDGRHFAAPEHVRDGFITLYEAVEKIEADDGLSAECLGCGETWNQHVCQE